MISYLVAEKIPLRVYVKQYSGDNGTDILHFMCPGIEPDAVAFDETIRTLEGDMHVSPGDYIVEGIRGEFYAVKPEIFDASYSVIGVGTR